MVNEQCLTRTSSSRFSALRRIVSALTPLIGEFSLILLGVRTILPVSVTRDRSRQTSGHLAHAIGAVASSNLTKKT